MRPFRIGISCPERLADEPLRAGHPGPLGIRGVPEQQVDAAVAELGQPPDVGLEPVHGRVVELPVAGVEDTARGRLDRDRHCVGDRMRHAHELEPETPEHERRPFGVGLDELRHRRHTVLLELRADEPEREPRRHDALHRHLTEDVREAADVILVPVGQHHRKHPAALEIREIRKNEVDAEMLVAREGETCVDDDDVVAQLVHGHVLADLAEAPERDDAQDVAHLA